MTAQAARVISYPQAEFQTQVNQETSSARAEDDFLAHLAQGGVDIERLQADTRRIMGEIAALRPENRWEDILALFHPVEDKLPELASSGLALPVLREIAFSLGHVGRYDEAIAIYHTCLESEPDNFHHHAGMAYTLYDSLYAAKARQVMLHPAERKQRTEQAHIHFQAAQRLRPEAVTNYYRQGALYKQIQNKKERTKQGDRRMKERTKQGDRRIIHITLAFWQPFPRCACFLSQ